MSRSQVQPVPLILRLDRRACAFLDDLAQRCDTDWAEALSLLLPPPQPRRWGTCRSSSPHN
jgi:hypothetical protein